MTGKRPAKHPIIGMWQIIAIEHMDDDELNAIGPSFIAFNRHPLEPTAGEMRFGTLEAEIDWRSKTTANQTRVEFSWDGTDENVPCQGRCKAILRADGILRGTVYEHFGDERSFAAKKVSKL